MRIGAVFVGVSNLNILAGVRAVSAHLLPSNTEAGRVWSTISERNRGWVNLDGASENQKELEDHQPSFPSIHSGFSYFGHCQSAHFSAHHYPNWC